MLRLLRSATQAGRIQVRVGLYQRQLLSSTNGKTSAELTTDEKATEVAKASMPWLKKYGIIIGSVALYFVVTITIINNEDLKGKMEEAFPTYGKQLAIISHYFASSSVFCTQRPAMTS